MGVAEPQHRAGYGSALLEEVPDGEFEHPAQPLEGVHARVRLVPLDLGEVSLGEAGLFGYVFEREVEGPPAPSQSGPDSGAGSGLVIRHGREPNKTLP
ncbi:hypothetical protein GCM10012287_16540 [Streptomyces daqingensis]|uniref:Uncharacterized protein n=1 Tax=Streptomyces daqingensis TaxID=1472640 RepID=A0ABQ2M396_9ACTN|nr:hypothetical protein GCM10012287_16540 [Streptomyces daqingensis]